MPLPAPNSRDHIKTSTRCTAAHNRKYAINNKCPPQQAATSTDYLLLQTPKVCPNCTESRGNESRSYPLSYQQTNAIDKQSTRVRKLATIQARHTCMQTPRTAPSKPRGYPVFPFHTTCVPRKQSCRHTRRTFLIASSDAPCCRSCVSLYARCYFTASRACSFSNSSCSLAVSKN